MPKLTGQDDEWGYGAIIAILTAIIVVLGAATFMLHRDSRLNASSAQITASEPGATGVSS